MPDAAGIRADESAIPGSLTPGRHMLRRSARALARRFEPGLQRGSPAAALAGHRPASPWRVFARDRPVAASPAADDHPDLRQGGHRQSAGHRIAMARGYIMSQL